MTDTITCSACTDSAMITCPTCHGNTCDCDRPGCATCADPATECDACDNTGRIFCSCGQ